ncbi:hypothetical protein V2J09_010452 [Rumex salicifolius]
MGNAAGKLSPCFCHTGEISGRHDIAVVFSSNSLADEGFGHSFCYIRPPESFATEDSISTKTTPFLPIISGASVSANASTPLSTILFDPFFPVQESLDRASCFESSVSFASVPLQPIPRHLITSDPLLLNPGSGSIPGSGPMDRGFFSGPIERGFLSGPIDRSSNLFSGNLEISTKTGDALPPENSVKSKYKPRKRSSIRGVKDAILAAINKRKMTLNDSVGKSTVTTRSIISSSSSSTGSSHGSLCDENDERLSMEAPSLQWAQGKAGEDRIHVVVSEENGWVFVGIYDGFNGPDATDFLLSNLYPAFEDEVKEIFSNDNEESDANGRINEAVSTTSFSPRCSVSEQCIWRKKGKMGAILAALSEALRKTEEAYLDVADKMILDNPVLSLMGSCVLVMLMAGDDVYLMNVGDSRAVLGRKVEVNTLESDTLDVLPNLSALQLTVDHNTLAQEEVQRIKCEHPDDHGVVTNDRVKGSLKVTRAFGAGFLKNPKWNEGLLEMLKIDYVGSSPYITCSPSLHHHKLSPKDKFLILSSDGLYQYFTNEEVVADVELFMSSTPEGDPAQHLIEEILFRAAKKAGLDFHELLDIPQGERRRFHDDVSIIIISFEGRIWRSSV